MDVLGTGPRRVPPVNQIKGEEHFREELGKKALSKALKVRRMSGSPSSFLEQHTAVSRHDRWITLCVVMREHIITLSPQGTH